MTLPVDHNVEIRIRRHNDFFYWSGIMMQKREKLKKLRYVVLLVDDTSQDIVQE